MERGRLIIRIRANAGRAKAVTRPGAFCTRLFSCTAERTDRLRRRVRFRSSRTARAEHSRLEGWRGAADGPATATASPVPKPRFGTAGTRGGAPRWRGRPAPGRVSLRFRGCAISPTSPPGRREPWGASPFSPPEAPAAGMPFSPPRAPEAGTGLRFVWSGGGAAGGRAGSGGSSGLSGGGVQARRRRRLWKPRWNMRWRRVS